MKKRHFFRIADFYISIVFENSNQNSISLLPSFSVFETEQPETDCLLFTLTVDDNLQPAQEKELIKKCDTGNGDTLVYTLPDGGYQYIIKDIYNNPCCLLHTNKDFSLCTCALNGTATMRSFGLNDALMLIFAFRGSHQDTLLIHASCVSHSGYAYPFIAKSGTGKSTHSSLWLKHIQGTELMNDDNPIIRIIDGKPFLYGSPWSGKTPCYKDIKAPLGAVTRIDRAPANRIERLRPVQAFASMLPSCSSMKWDSIIYNNICNIITRLVETVPMFTMHCLPDKEAALVCHKGIAGSGS